MSGQIRTNWFHILTALAGEDLHGSAIARDVSRPRPRPVPSGRRTESPEPVAPRETHQPTSAPTLSRSRAESSEDDDGAEETRSAVVTEDDDAAGPAASSSV